MHTYTRRVLSKGLALIKCHKMVHDNQKNPAETYFCQKKRATYAFC